jgi:hypothetical protein
MDLFGSLTLFGGGILVFSLFIAISVAILVFEIWMFVDLIKNNRIPQDRKILWGIFMLLIHPFTAIAYYFTDHRPKQT